MKKVILILICAISILCVSSFAFAADKVIVLSFTGDVKLTPPGAAAPIECKKEMLLEEGTRIATSGGAYVRIAFNEVKSNIVEVRENTEVVLKLDGADKIELINGEVFNVLQGLKQREEFRVRTPNAVCAARGSVNDIKAKAQETNVAAIEKSAYVTITSTQKEFEVKEGFQTVIIGIKEKIIEMSNTAKQTYAGQAEVVRQEENMPPAKEEEKKTAPGTQPPSDSDDSGGGTGGGGTGTTTSHLQGRTSYIVVAHVASTISSIADPVNTACEKTGTAVSGSEYYNMQATGQDPAAETADLINQQGQDNNLIHVETVVLGVGGTPTDNF